MIYIVYDYAEEGPEHTMATADPDKVFDMVKAWFEKHAPNAFDVAFVKTAISRAESEVLTADEGLVDVDLVAYGSSGWGWGSAKLQVVKPFE